MLIVIRECSVLFSNAALFVKKKALQISPKCFMSYDGLEPSTAALKGRCSTY